MKVGLVGTAAIAHKHAQAYKNIGFELVVCSNRNQERGRKFAEQYAVDFVPDFQKVCSDPRVDYVDVCTFPELRLEPVLLCGETGKHVLVQKPMATNVATARQMVMAARNSKITLGVVSQHRFDESCQFLVRALQDGRLGRVLQCDCYVKWYRSQEYYSRSVKGSWKTEGGGALINQAIHQVDLLRWFAGPVDSVFASWQLGAVHQIESEDVVSAVVRYESGATGVVQASTAFRPGYPERIEIHGTKGSAIITGDRLTAWDIQDDNGPRPPLHGESKSGSSDPMAISLESFERQFLDFAAAIREHRKPLVAGEDGFDALAVVEAIYASCGTGKPAQIEHLV